LTCPICARETDPKYRPFCSRRCADVDLGRWLTGGYAIPAEEAEDDAAEGEEGREDRPDRH
jgi:endogenous inhibitor of DNA gyrase (YacG/DUF329 family)